jgi:hypothetical protein
LKIRAESQTPRTGTMADASAPQVMLFLPCAPAVRSRIQVPAFALEINLWLGGRFHVRDGWVAETLKSGSGNARADVRRRFSVASIGAAAPIGTLAHRSGVSVPV